MDCGGDFGATENSRRPGGENVADLAETDQLRQAVGNMHGGNMHGGTATLAQTAPVKETFEGQVLR